MGQDRSALGAFLRSRRDRLTPAQAGMQAFPGARRVPGLRKEELAVLAGVSPDYYGRLEQGRQANISREVLDALARALRLDETERAHLDDLAQPSERRPRTPDAAQRPDPGLLRMMTVLDHVPILVLGRRAEILASNALLTAVLREFPVGTSFARFMFLDPLARERIRNWEHFAATTIAALRREMGRHPDDRRLVALVEELIAADDDVRRWWTDHSVRDYTSVAKQIDHPVAADLCFDIEILTLPHDADQRLVVYTVEPGSRTARLLPMVASWRSGVPDASSDSSFAVPAATTNGGRPAATSQDAAQVSRRSAAVEGQWDQMS